jgi:hypothetical protein
MSTVIPCSWRVQATLSAAPERGGHLGRRTAGAHGLVRIGGARADRGNVEAHDGGGQETHIGEHR